VSLAITVVSIVAFASIAYSVYQDYQGILGVLNQKGASSSIAENTVVRGNNVILYVNATLPNRGLYPITLGVACIGGNSTQLSCNAASVTIPPGGEGTLHLMGTVPATNPSQSLASFKGRFTFSLASFASIGIVVDLGNFKG
jgi:hypothetical protein